MNADIRAFYWSGEKKRGYHFVEESQFCLSVPKILRGIHNFFSQGQKICGLPFSVFKKLGKLFCLFGNGKI